GGKPGRGPRAAAVRAHPAPGLARASVPAADQGCGGLFGRLAIVRRSPGGAMNSGFGSVARAEWTKVRSVPSTAWSVLALIGLTVLLSFFVAGSVGLSGGGAGCRT